MHKALEKINSVSALTCTMCLAVCPSVFSDLKEPTQHSLELWSNPQQWWITAHGYMIQLLSFRMKILGVVYILLRRFWQNGVPIAHYSNLYNTSLILALLPFLSHFLCFSTPAPWDYLPNKLNPRSYLKCCFRENPDQSKIER